MDYTQPLKYHYRPKKGWINDPNGLVYYKGYYHVFYQHAPHFEKPWHEPMHWGHARTKDFLEWEELPVALAPDAPYDSFGCWSGTAIVKDGVLYLFYASLYVPEGEKEPLQTVSVAYSTDGVPFEKYDKNPVIAHFPTDGGPDFRDPAVCFIDGAYYCVMGTGHKESKTGRLLLYKSADLFNWEYCGIMSEWGGAKYIECPSFLPAGDKYLLTASICKFEKHYFWVMYGDFCDGKFTATSSAEVDRGPDQYAGQVFRDHKGRNILISWTPGWRYAGLAEKDIGCMSLPRELKLLEDGRIVAYPLEEVRHLLCDSDPALVRTEDGFTVERSGREPLIYTGKIRDLKLLRDGYLLEIFVNGGEEVFTVLL